MKVVLVLASVFSFSAAEAASLPKGDSLQRLFSATNDKDGRIRHVSISYSEEGKATGAYLSHEKNSQGEGDDWFRLSEIESSRGALLIKERGFEALFLLGKFNDETQEGRFRLRFLANGLFKKYEHCDFLLKRSGTNWYVQNAYNGRPVDRVHIDTHALGIKTIEGICPPESD